MTMLALLLAAAPALPPCRPAQLRLIADGRDGDFNGMSHGGVALVLRNVGTHACTVAARPRVTFYDARGRVLPTAARRIPGQTAGGVAIRPGRTAETALRWISGPVYDRNRCVDAARVGVRIGGETLRAAGGGRMCGEAGRAIAFDQAGLAPGAAG